MEKYQFLVLRHFLRVEVSSIKFPPLAHYIGPTVSDIFTNTIIHPGSLLPMGCPIKESNNMAIQRRNTDGQTDRQTDGQTDGHFF